MKLTGIPRAATFPRMTRVKQTFRGPAVGTRHATSINNRTIAPSRVMHTF